MDKQAHHHHEGNKDVNRRLPLPLERATPWIDDRGRDTGYWRRPSIWSAKDGEQDMGHVAGLEGLRVEMISTY